MADTPNETGLSPETAALAALGRGDEVAPAVSAPAVEEPAAAPVGETQEAPQRPDYVPEKFWDADKGEVRTEALLKSYAELEKSRSKPQVEEGAEAESEAEGQEAKEDAEQAAAAPISAELFQSAQAEFATDGDITAETREKIIASGIPEEVLDTYLSGVKALSVALTEAVYGAAGGQEDYQAAIEWARDNWPEGRITKFDTALNDPDLMPTMVTALMAEFRTAQPGEGVQTRPSGGANSGDTYSSPEEFTRDLAAADQANDIVARRQAVAKLERSKKAGTLAHVTPRNGPQRTR